MQLLPGFIFGVALIIPNFNQSRLPNNWVLLMPLLFSMLNVFLLFFGMMLGILNNSYSDKSGDILIALVSGIVFISAFNIFYGLERPLLTYLLLGVIGVAISLLWDYLYFTPRDKEDNLGTMLGIWQFSIGLTVVLLVDIKPRQAIKV